MSWGYWGITAGLLILVTLFFFALNLFYGGIQGPTDAETQTPKDGGEAKPASGSRHAA